MSMKLHQYGVWGRSILGALLFVACALDAFGADGFDGVLDNPQKIAIDLSDNIYVTDTGNNQVQKFDPDGNFILAWPGFSSPMGIAVDRHGDVYVGDSGHSRILKFDANGNFITAWGGPGTGNGQFGWIAGIAVDRSSGYLYAVDQGNNRVQTFDASGNYLFQWGGLGSNPGNFNTPTGIAVDPHGQVYVADYQNFRVQKFDANGGYITRWGSEGELDGQFKVPFGVAADASGNVYVVDYSIGRVQKFSANGNYLLKWGESGFGQKQFWMPDGIATNSEGSVYVVDSGNDRIKKFSGDGVYLGTVGLSIGSFSGFSDCDTKERKRIFSLADTCIRYHLGLSSGITDWDQSLIDPYGSIVGGITDYQYEVSSVGIITGVYMYMNPARGLLAGRYTLNINLKNCRCQIPLHPGEACPIPEYCSNAGSFQRYFLVASATQLLTVAKSGTGNGLIASSPAGIYCASVCSETYASDTVITLTATAEPGSTFISWSGCTPVAINPNQCTVSMNADQTVTANFASAPTRQVSVPNIDGTAGSQRFFKINPPVGVTQLVIETEGGSGNPSLYLKAGAKPQATDADCASTNAGTAERCAVQAPQAGLPYYILLQAESAYSGVTLRVSWSQEAR